MAGRKQAAWDQQRENQQSKRRSKSAELHKSFLGS
jgi:hypothetical protein